MKKLFLLSVAFLISTTLLAEKHQLGDYVEKDGVPSIVAWVDSTGEHGLLLSITAGLFGIKTEDKKNSIIKTLTTRYKRYHQARVKKQGAEALAEIDERYERQMEMVDKFMEMPALPYLLYSKTPNIRTAALEDIKKDMNGSGEQNTKLLVNFCKEKEISMCGYFPEFYWVTNLGPDWFVPGNDELELIAQSLKVEGFGKDYTVKIPRAKNSKELYNTFDSIFNSTWNLIKNVSLGLDYNWTPLWFGDIFWPLWAMNSSTMVQSSWSEIPENIAKTGKFVALDRPIPEQTFYSLRLMYYPTKYYWWFMKNDYSFTCGVSKF